MADFLGNLVNRTLDRGPALRPRTPSLVESWPVPGALSPEPSPGPETAQETAAALQPPPARPAPDPDPATPLPDASPEPIP